MHTLLLVWFSLIPLHSVPCYVESDGSTRWNDSIPIVAPNMIRTTVVDSMLLPCPAVNCQKKPHPHRRSIQHKVAMRTSPRKVVRSPIVHRPYSMAHRKRKAVPMHPSKTLDRKRKLCLQVKTLTVGILSGEHPTSIVPVWVAALVPPDIPELITPPNISGSTIAVSDPSQPQLIGWATIPGVFWFFLHNGDGGGQPHTSPLDPLNDPGLPPVTTTPEPSIWVLLGTGLGAFFIVVRRRRSS
jgi:hypothetical protein